MEGWGLVYQEVNKDKVVSEYEPGRMLLSDDK